MTGAFAGSSVCEFRGMMIAIFVLVLSNAVLVLVLEIRSELDTGVRTTLEPDGIADQIV